jgi:UDP:flavonoid glycosyltransferase YjiC (YdhE family)
MNFLSFAGFPACSDMPLRTEMPRGGSLVASEAQATAENPSPSISVPRVSLAEMGDQLRRGRGPDGGDGSLDCERHHWAEVRLGPSQGQVNSARNTRLPGRRILFATIGSLGDIHPCIALGLELKERGHLVTIATTEHYRNKIVKLGFNFHPLRPAWDPTSGELVGRCNDLKRGPEVLIRELILPHLNDTYDDLVDAARNTDLMLAGELNYAAPIAAEKLASPWASIILSPISFFSSYDPSLLVNAPFLIHLRNSGPLLNRLVLQLSRAMTNHWWKPVRSLRKREGLHSDCNPLLGDKFSPHLTLALFSRHFAAAQPDWPEHTIQPGFVFFDDSEKDPATNEALEQFLEADAVDAPIVFTQGSTATHHPGDFHDVNAGAARRLGKRAVLVGARDRPTLLDAGTLALPYVPYSSIFPRASVIVHQGGSGTTGQALRAGKPMLIVPYGWDQPDNALRIERLGAGLHLPRTSYTEQGASEALRRLLREPRYAARSAEIGSRIRAETSVAQARDAIETLLQ